MTEKESLRPTALTELREKEERVNQLCLLLKQTTHEREEARNHLHQLQLQLQKLTQQPVDPFPPTNPIWANSSLTDSDNDSLDSAFDEIDCALEEMDRLEKVRALPEKGRLMQAVTDVAPLLKKLLVAVGEEGEGLSGYWVLNDVVLGRFSLVFFFVGVESTNWNSVEFV
ncbi:hypothetical protein QJS10_CPB20g00891 [Acorus calamus]|uniref:Uncharacterized protein n=1 Tax=Acorus calamus TaxID=4465 RepID=A0AAV9CB36_ACOCL|nr:hypothetical protein QJS10_CPB20g00891 [Acorus calamus]